MIPQPASACRVLAVDDNPTNLVIIEELVEDRFELHTATNGLDALELARRVRPDVVLLDIMMPGIDGYETCRRMRAEPVLAHTKIIMVSAKALVNERLEGYESGADDYVTKPFDHQEFLSKLAVYARLKRVEEVDALRSNVLDLLSRGTKTPVHEVLSPCELLLAEADMSLAERRTLARAAYDATRRLQKLVDDVTTLTALRAGKWDLVAEPLDCAAIAKAAIGAPASDGPPPDAVAFDVEPGVAGHADPGETRVVLQTMLAAAWRLAGAHGTVTMRVRADGSAVAIEVAANTNATAPNVGSLFEPFEKTACSQDQTDLRLAIAAEILRAMGGSAEATADGAGVTMRARIPARPRVTAG